MQVIRGLVGYTLEDMNISHCYVPLGTLTFGRDMSARSQYCVMLFKIQYLLQVWPTESISMFFRWLSGAP